MKRFFIVSLLAFAGLVSFAQGNADDRIYDYIDQYHNLAMSEMESYKIPASITLAQAIYATNAGVNKVSREANNHFGITCHQNEWQGETYYETDNHEADYCIRKYATVAESYRDHSLFIANRPRYRELFDLPQDDYVAWARGLQRLGYSGSSIYADTLISLIENYNLTRFDRKVFAKNPVAQVEEKAPSVSAPTYEKRDKNNTSAKIEQPVTEPVVEKSETITKPEKEEPIAKTEAEPVAQSVPMSHQTVDGSHVFTLDPAHVQYKEAYFPYSSRPVYENNKTKFILAKKGDTYKSLAATLMMKEEDLRKYNDVYDESDPIENEVVYVQMKSTRSSVASHKLEQGDTFRYISQLYGVQLKLIIKRNSGAISSYDIGDMVNIGGK